MGNELRVLIVEDSEDDALLIVHKLRHGGYDPVFERVDTEEAMRKALAKKAWDIIVCDYVMPQFSGLEALKVLQRSELDVPLIIVSGKIGEDVAVEAMRADARDYVMKDNMAKLVPAVERELHEAEMRKERKRALEALRESEMRYRNLVESARDVIFTVSQEGSITSLNPAFEKITGWSREEWLGKNFPPLVHPDDLPLTMDIYQRVLKGEKPPPIIETRILSKSGEYLNVEISITLLTQNGKTISGLGIARDITERKRMEEALHRAHDELELRVRERTEELRRRTEELARSNAELEQFAYVASHDLQEPLRMVSSFTQLLARRYRGKLDSDADEFIAYIVDGARRMQNLIEDLLTYSRIGRRGKPFRPTSLNSALDQALANLKVIIEENDAEITRDPLPDITADFGQMVQLFQNLIGNAIKFRKKEEPPRIRITSRKEKGEWLFSVSDNGIGISPEFKNRLFQIFQREHAASEYPGTGIGLVTCKKIVERHGGRIWAESRLGEGSTLRFTIPAGGGEW